MFLAQEAGRHGGGNESNPGQVVPDHHAGAAACRHQCAALRQSRGRQAGAVARVRDQELRFLPGADQPRAIVREAASPLFIDSVQLLGRGEIPDPNGWVVAPPRAGREEVRLG